MRRLLIVVSTAAIGLVALAFAARGQTQAEWREAQQAAPPPAEQAAAPELAIVEGYHGVTPGAGNLLPRVAELKGKPDPWITWPGFALREDGGSRVFIQTTSAVKYTSVDKKKSMTLKFKGTKVYLSNNRNPLVTTHFNTPLKRAYLKHKRKDVELVLELKVQTGAAITQSTDQDGYAYLFIDFPPGTYPIIERKPAAPGDYSSYLSKPYSSPSPKPPAAPPDEAPAEAPAEAKQ